MDSFIAVITETFSRYHIIKLDRHPPRLIQVLVVLW